MALQAQKYDVSEKINQTSTERTNSYLRENLVARKCSLRLYARKFSYAKISTFTVEIKHQSYSWLISLAVAFSDPAPPRCYMWPLSPPFLCVFWGFFFYRSSSALHRRTSPEILSRPLGHLLWRGSPNVCFLFGSSRIRTHVLVITKQTLYRSPILTP